MRHREGVELKGTGNSEWVYLMAAFLPALLSLSVVLWHVCSWGRKKKTVEGEQKKGLVPGRFGPRIVPPRTRNDRGNSSEAAEMYDGLERKEKKEQNPSKDSHSEPDSDQDSPGSAKKIIEVENTAEEISPLRKIDDVLDEKEQLCAKLQYIKMTKKMKEAEERMALPDRMEESRVKQQQLESIYRLMKSQEAEFGIDNQEDMVEQLKLYAM